MKYRQIGFVGISVLVIGILIYGYVGNKSKNDSNLGQYLEAEKQIMKRMMMNMKQVPETGDVAVHFLYGMIPHHVGAIEMAEAVLAFGGTNEEIKQIAENVIQVQTLENEQMKELALELEKNPQINKEKKDAYLKEYNKMFYESHGSHGSMGAHGEKGKSVDQAFAEGMIIHHEMAIEMAESVLKYTDNETVKEMAQTIITVQEEEIAVMKKIIQEMK